MSPQLDSWSVVGFNCLRSQNRVDFVSMFWNVYRTNFILNLCTEAWNKYVSISFHRSLLLLNSAFRYEEQPSTTTMRNLYIDQLHISRSNLSRQLQLLPYVTEISQGQATGYHIKTSIHDLTQADWEGGNDISRLLLLSVWMSCVKRFLYDPKRIYSTKKICIWCQSRNFKDSFLFTFFFPIFPLLFLLDSYQLLCATSH